MLHLAHVSVMVRDYDEAIAFYVGVLGLVVAEDTDLGGGKRWVRLAGAGGGDLLLSRAVTDAQLARVGDQTGGKVFLFLHTDDFAREHARLLAAGVQFIEAPRDEPYGAVAVFLDLYGNKLDLIGRQRSRTI